MRIKIKERNYEIVFQHNSKIKATSCVVLCNKEVVGSSLIASDCSAGKCYSKDENRKRSLQVALSRVSSEDRWHIWNDLYRTMTQTPRWPAQKLSKELKTKLDRRDIARLIKNGMDPKKATKTVLGSVAKVAKKTATKPTVKTTAKTTKKTTSRTAKSSKVSKSVKKK